MPPIETPVEASDRLAFTPECLSEIDNPPVLYLRAVTDRDQRHFRRTQTEEGLVTHDDEEIRRVTKSELKRLWSPEDYVVGIARLEQFWHTLDDFRIQRKDDPELEFEYDKDEIAAIDALSDRLAQASPLLRRMQADNDDAAIMRPRIFVSTVVDTFKNLDVKLKREGGYLTLDCAKAIQVELAKIAEKNGVEPKGLANLELMGACARRFKLDADTEKNSASPSPSDSALPNSESGDETNGKSPASAKSPETTSGE